MIGRRGLLALGAAVLALAAPVGAQPVVRMPAQDQVLRVRPQPLFTVGAEDGRDWEVFGSVAGVAFDSRDNLYVFDKRNVRVVVFDSTGRFVRALGRRGGGPGEFMLPEQMTVTPNDELVVLDLGRRAYSIFGPDGTFRRNVPIAEGSFPFGSKLASHPRGGIVLLSVGNPASRTPDAVGDEVLLRQPLSRGAPTTLVVLQTSEQRAGPKNTLVMSRPRVFSPSTRFAVLPNGGIVLANTESYSVQIVESHGTASRVIERSIAPRRVTARDREYELERRRTVAAPGRLTIAGAPSGAISESMSRQIAQQIQDVEFANVIPVIQDIQVDPAGNLWIQRSGPGLDRPGPIDLVTPQGRYLGTLTGVGLPAAFSIRGSAAYVEADDVGVQRVVVVRFSSRR